MPRRYKQNCKQCGKYYEKAAKFFCSVHCSDINTERLNKIKIANPKGHCKNTGRTHFKKGDHLNELSFNWKGDEVGKVPLHLWVIRRLGKPTKCEFCGKDNLSGHKIHWANKSRTYKRDITDWIRLCVSCHKKYDFKMIPNLQKNNTTGHKGVYWNKMNKNWRAKIKVNQKSIDLGSYSKFKEAVLAREDAERRYFDS